MSTDSALRSASDAMDNNIISAPALSPSLPQLATGSSTPTIHDINNNNSSSNNHHPLAQILGLYHKATSTFLLRQLASAYSLSLEALELLATLNQNYGLDLVENSSVSTRRSFYVLKQKLWILHATIFGAMLSDRAAAAGAHNGIKNKVSGPASSFLSYASSSPASSAKDSPEKLVRDLWRRLVEDYGGLEGDVDGQVMVSFTLLCVNQKLYTLGRQIVEAYLATIPEGMLIHLETAAGVSLSMSSKGASAEGHGDKDPLMVNYERLVELYLIHVLAKLSEWDYATDFLQYNSVLSDSSKKTYGKILDKLHQKSLRPKRVLAKKQESHPHSVASSKSGSVSASASNSPSTPSTSVSSPTLSSISTMGSPATSHSMDHRHLEGASVNGSVGHNDERGLKKSASGSQSSSGKSNSNNNNNSASGSTRTKLVVTKQGSASSVSTLQGRLLLLLQHYVELVKSASSQMGTNQLMVIVGLVVFLGALSRNRVRATKYLKAGMDKVMQTVKMGTTVTSI
ncbi:hypothetical protein EDD11_009900 [Mortierella claussenii]|nr:hypothetical protein EDD11_009900 [Mortierella claussenii]